MRHTKKKASQSSRSTKKRSTKKKSSKRYAMGVRTKKAGADHVTYVKEHKAWRDAQGGVGGEKVGGRTYEQLVRSIGHYWGKLSKAELNARMRQLLVWGKKKGTSSTGPKRR